MEKIIISEEQFRQAVSWLNGGPSVLGEKEVLGMLRALAGAFRDNCRKLREGPVARISLPPERPFTVGSVMAEALAEAQAGREDREAGAAPAAPGEAQAVQPPAALDSVLLVESIAHVAASAGFPVTRSRAQIILYCLYGGALASPRGRLEVEHPQVWKYGPVFPRAYKRAALQDPEACSRAFRRLREGEPRLAAVLSERTRAMMATPMADLHAVHRAADSPYGRALKRNPGKWGETIPDEEIAAFFGRERRITPPSP